MSRTDAQKSLEEAPKVVSEDALNAVIVHQLLDVLDDKKIMPTIKGGNIAIGNEQRGVEKFSLYYKSRPDFMLCTDTLGVALKHKQYSRLFNSYRMVLLGQGYLE